MRYLKSRLFAHINPFAIKAQAAVVIGPSEESVFTDPWLVGLQKATHSVSLRFLFVSSSMFCSLGPDEATNEVSKRSKT